MTSSRRDNRIARIVESIAVRWLELLGATTGMIGSYLISEPTRSLMISGWALFIVSNVCLIRIHIRHRVPYLVLMQSWYLFTAIKGIYMLS